MRGFALHFISGFVSAAILFAPSVVSADDTRVENKTLEVYRMGGINADGTPRFERHTIEARYEDNDEWAVRCGHEIVKYAVARFGAVGRRGESQERTNVRRAALFGSMDEIVVRRVRRGPFSWLTGDPTPRARLQNRRLVIEFDTDTDHMGMAFCRANEALRDVNSIYARQAELPDLYARRNRRNRDGGTISIPIPDRNGAPEIDHDRMRENDMDEIQRLLNQVTDSQQDDERDEAAEVSQRRRAEEHPEEAGQGRDVAHDRNDPNGTGAVE